MSPSPELLARLAERFAVLGEVNRLRLLQSLKGGEARVGDLAERIGLGQPSVSKHLGLLRQAGLVSVVRRGTEAWYAIRDETLFELCDLVCASVQDQLRTDLAAVTSTRRR